MEHFTCQRTHVVLRSRERGNDVVEVNDSNPTLAAPADTVNISLAIITVAPSTLIDPHSTGTYLAV